MDGSSAQKPFPRLTQVASGLLAEHLDYPQEERGARVRAKQSRARMQAESLKGLKIWPDDGAVLKVIIKGG